MDARLIFDPPGRGDWNMAVDEALLATAGEAGVVTLRFYQWSEPTLSLGYFQRSEDRRLHTASVNCPLVRRATGGGAILHDQELTYGLAIPLNHPLAKESQRLYRQVHLALIEVLRRAGINADLCERADRSSLPAEPFLCFQRRAEGDVLLGDDKICGSAQRRHKNAVLQHGSILLGRSPLAPELTGVKELTGLPLQTADMASALSTRLGELLGFKWRSGELSAGELAQSETLRLARFADDAWTLRR